MTLRITKETDPIVVSQLVIAIYAPPGIGKSTLAFTSEAPLMLDFDRGSYRAGNRKDVVQVEGWSDVAGITADDLKPYKTVIVDTAGRALDVLSADIIKSDPKMGRGGALTLQGFGRLKSEFIQWTRMLRTFGVDVILIAHSDEQHKGDELIERIDMQGASKNEVYKSADAMGRLSIQNGKRVLNFSPTDAAFGKNPGSLEPLVFPHPSVEPHFMAGVIKSIKDKLNALSAEQQAVAGLLSEWATKIEGVSDAAAFDALAKDSGNADERIRQNVKRMIMTAATKSGFEFDQSAKLFRAKAA